MFLMTTFHVKCCSFDYGRGYAKNNLDGICLCGEPDC